MAIKQEFKIIIDRSTPKEFAYWFTVYSRMHTAEYLSVGADFFSDLRIINPGDNDLDYSIEIVKQPLQNLIDYARGKADIH